MQVAIIIYEPQTQFDRRDNAEAPTYWGAWTAYGQALTEAGIMVGGAGLQPPSAAVTLSSQEGKRTVQDGPYADTREQLGGFYLIEVPDMETALQWASRCPAYGTGVIEVRPLLVM